MDRLGKLLPLLTGSQIDALASVAAEMVAASRKARERSDMLTVQSASAEYGVPQSTIRTAMRDGRLPYRTPHGQTKPKYVSRSSFESWMTGDDPR